jgi:predicted KAP-like P-loop ATPase
MSDQEASRPLAGDRPIDSPEQDTIGRGGFARQIQYQIETAPRGEGLVIAVTGEWGSGKTSVINLALSPLEAAQGYRVVRFNPWLFSGTPQLIEHFFSDLKAELAASGNTRLKEVGEALERYGATIDPLRFLPGADKAAALTTTFGRILRGREISISRQRDELNRLLAKHDELLVVVVDDIDRLHDQEVGDVMRLVRLVADFPNTVYVLAFDVKRVARAVGGPDSDAGHAYVEKIVQVSHEVPAISGEQLSQMLLERIDAALRSIKYRLNQQHWSRLYLVFRRYFRTPRDVSRYCNHVRAPMWLLAGEIEAADVLALEALRLFEPDFWTELPYLITELTTILENPLLPSTPAPDGDRLKSSSMLRVDLTRCENSYQSYFPRPRSISAVRATVRTRRPNGVTQDVSLTRRSFRPISRSRSNQARCRPSW